MRWKCSMIIDKIQFQFDFCYCAVESNQLLSYTKWTMWIDRTIWFDIRDHSFIEKGEKDRRTKKRERRPEENVARVIIVRIEGRQNFDLSFDEAPNTSIENIFPVCHLKQVNACRIYLLHVVRSEMVKPICLCPLLVFNLWKVICIW